jgi:DNA-binding MarR family transcriptional regulator
MDAASRTNLDDDLGFLMSRLGTTTRLRLAEAVAPLDLTLRQFVVLRTIDANEGLSQAQLGERLRIDASSIVQVLDDCQKAGLAERRPSPQDRRRYAIHLTEAGRLLLSNAYRAVRAEQDELFAALDATQRAQLLDLLLALAASGPLSSPAASPTTVSVSGAGR